MLDFEFLIVGLVLFFRLCFALAFWLFWNFRSFCFFLRAQFSYAFILLFGTFFSFYAYAYNSLPFCLRFLFEP